jgi:hypothetical protein
MRNRVASAVAALAALAATTAPGAAAATPEPSIRALLSYTKVSASGQGHRYRDPRIRILRGGTQLFAEVVPVHPRGRPSEDEGVFGYSSALLVRDLDGDREPEVVLPLDWNGAHCCSWWRVYRYDASRKTYRPVNRFWGNTGAAPSLRDVDGDGRPELVSRDDRFAFRFGAGYADSAYPIQIWAYDQGRFRDVTRRFPGLIERDAVRHWRAYRSKRGTPSARPPLAAWAADEYQLELGAEVQRELAAALRRRYLGVNEVEPRGPGAYVNALRAFLRQTGYIR